MTIVSIHKSDESFNEEWFFSTDHCQPNLGNEWVPVTHYNTTYEEVRNQNNEGCIIGAKCIEIENPNPSYSVSDRRIAMQWWNSLSLEEKFYKVIPWFKSQNINVTERHPDSLTGREIEIIYKNFKL